MNYVELKAQIQAYVENYGTDFLASIDTMIAQAERRIYNDARLPVSRKTTAVLISAGQAVLPADFIEAQEVSFSGVLLVQKDPSFLLEAYGTAAGNPEFYAYKDQTTLMFAPTPSSGSLAVSYFGYPESIVTASTTWLGDNYDHALLSACLFEAAMYMKAEADMIAVYKAQYDTAVAPLKALTKGDKFRTG